MPQRADLPALDVDRVHVEELDVRDRAAVEALQDLGRVRALDLEAIVPADDRLAAGDRGRSIVAGELDLPAAGLRVELHPVDGRRAADQIELVLRLAKHDHVADDVAVIAARRELLGPVGREVRKAVGRERREHLHRVRAGDEKFRHVVRLIEEDRRLAPGSLLVAPVRVLGRNHRVHVGPDLRVPQKVDRTLAVCSTCSKLC